MPKDQIITTEDVKDPAASKPMDKFQALVARLDDDGIRAAVETLEEAELPAGGVTIRVHYSSVNYKDALALTSKGGVVRDYPIVPGIDLTGEVVSSDSDEFDVGDLVLAHGYEIGTGRHGGYAEYARVPADWVVKLGTLSPRDGAAIGTAGFTAAMSVQALQQRGITPEDGPILVTGATGGVGSVSIDLLSAAGYQVVASTGKPDAAERLRALGADRSSAGYLKIPRPSRDRWVRRNGPVQSTVSAGHPGRRAQHRALRRRRGRQRTDRRRRTADHRDAVHLARCGVTGHRLGTDADRTAARVVGAARRFTEPQHLSDVSHDVDVKDVVGCSTRSALEGIPAARWYGSQAVLVRNSTSRPQPRTFSQPSHLQTNSHALPRELGGPLLVQHEQ